LHSPVKEYRDHPGRTYTRIDDYPQKLSPILRDLFEIVFFIIPFYLRYILDTLNTYSLIPVRSRKRKRIFGYYRKQIAESFDEIKYPYRNKVETVFSILKRKFGESLKSRKFRLQVKAIKIKVILYTISRMISTLSILIIFEKFYRAKIFICKYYTTVTFTGKKLCVCVF
jgi:hypothetical protein